MKHEWLVVDGIDSSRLRDCNYSVELEFSSLVVPKVIIIARNTVYNKDISAPCCFVDTATILRCDGRERRAQEGVSRLLYSTNEEPPKDTRVLRILSYLLPTYLYIVHESNEHRPDWLTTRLCLAVQTSRDKWHSSPR